MARIWNKHKQINNPLKRKVLVALSGGVDSAVVAALLVKAGYRVTAAFMINYDEPTPARSSCWLPDYRDATRVAARLGIPIIKLDFIKAYREQVLAYLFNEYQAGRTPNPDVLCNKYIKFGGWLEAARQRGFDYLATGHYARLESVGSAMVKLAEARDKNKDQTYFLHQLTQEQLKRALFPVGDYHKSEVRSLARRLALPVAEKEESMGICFIGEVPMKEFLQTRIKSQPGPIVMVNGAVLGRHEGLAFYTIGQRHIGVKIKGESKKFDLNKVKGLKSDNRPLYVVAKRLEKNELVVGYEDDPFLYTKKITVADVNWISGQPSKFPLQCLVRLRHRQPLQECTVTDKRGRSRGAVHVEFTAPQRAVTPGQFAVFYKNGECLGGGEIQ